MKTRIFPLKLLRPLPCALWLAMPAALQATPEMGPLTSEEIAAFIEMDIQGDRRLTGTDVKIRIENGIVDLTGVSLSLARAERAAARALATDGVRAVVNRVRIVKAVAGDEALVDRVETSLRQHPALDAREIRVAVEDGRLTLAGTVGTWDEQELARDLAAEIPGVQAIDEELIVTFEGLRSDEAIRAQVLHVIARDPLFDGLPLDVDVKSGVVRLGGETGTSGERERLILQSHVTGVFSVEAGELLVNPDLAMEAMAAKAPGDRAILAAFRDALAVDPRVEADSIGARCENGILFLKGAVRTREERSAVAATARGVAGVLKVVNEVQVAGGREQAALLR